jgi:hypothetical protein
MNYEEIKKRLNKCQVTLELIQTKGVSTKDKGDSKDVNKVIKVLKESIKKYKKILKEEESYLLTPKGGKPTLAKLSDDEVTALKSSDDVDKIKTAAGEEVKENSLFKKNNGVEFDQNETKKIAKEVGKSLAIALKKGGDELESMKAHHIEPNSFDIHVEYKAEGNMDEFSFYIIDDALHLVDFSFDKELVEVGVKPSGEAIINRDVLANELLKHFKSLSEEYNFKGRKLSHEEEDRLDLIAHREFDGVSFSKLSDKDKEKVFAKRDKVGVKEGEGDDHHYLKVSRGDYKKAMSILDQNVDPTYVKMEVVDNDGAGNVIIYFVFRHEYGFDDMYDDPEGKENPEFYQEPDEDPSAFMYDVVMDLRANDITVVDSSADMDENYDPDQEQKDDEEDHGVAYDDDGRPLGEDLDIGHQDDEPSMLKSSAFETATYAAKLAKKLAQYDQVDGEVDFPNWWQKKLILARDYMSAAYHYLDSEEKQPLIDKLALEHAMNEGTELYDKNGINIKRFSGGKRGLMVQITYGGDYIHVPAEEFSTLARAMQSVQGDLKDMSTQIPRRKNMDEASAAKIQTAYGKVISIMKDLAKKYKAGDKSVVDQLRSLTITKKKLEAELERAVAGTHHSQELTEVTEDEVQDAIRELRDLIDEIESKGEEAREVVRHTFPNELSRLDAYGAFNNMYSGNRYDVTLGGFVDRLEEEGYEIEDGEVYTNESVLKEFTDDRFKGSEVIDDANKRAPDMFGKQLFADLLPKGVASENDAFEALKKHDKSGIKARMGQYAPMFVHMQYHNLEHEGQKYRMHQKQYYNSNFKDKDPDFNPGVSEITLMKVDENDEGHNLGTILVKTDQYVQDLRNLPGLGKRHMEEATRQDLGMTSSVSKRRAGAELKQKLAGKRSDGMGKYDGNIYGLDNDGKRVELKSLNDLNKFKKFELDADINEAKGGQIMPGDYVKNQHGNIYQRVDGKVGRHDAYVRVINGKPGKRKTGLHDSFKLTLVNKDELTEGATCCGKCGRVHVKGNCKRPFLKGKSHCRNK